ncbi:MAG: hypothetical protein NTY10_04240 [Candidatus Omnitrophica bacterium]|nr:hypothetical protein [Candidatus Omnitrophota bacterium]
MNKKIVIFILFTIVALVVLALFSFGPLAGKRKSAAINPVSQKPQGAEPIPINNQPVQFNDYINKDIKENYYAFTVPRDWQVRSGQNAGSYVLTFPEGNGTIELLDVPDNSTLELFILSQREPLLKKSLGDYVRKDYKKLTVNNNEAYELTFNSTDHGQFLTTSKTYIAGLDNAAVITLNVKRDKFVLVSPVFIAAASSFAWKNK